MRRPQTPARITITFRCGGTAIIEPTDVLPLMDAYHAATVEHMSKDHAGHGVCCQAPLKPLRLGLTDHGKN